MFCLQDPISYSCVKVWKHRFMIHFWKCVIYHVLKPLDNTLLIFWNEDSVQNVAHRITNLLTFLSIQTARLKTHESLADFFCMDVGDSQSVVQVCGKSFLKEVQEHISEKWKRLAWTQWCRALLCPQGQKCHGLYHCTSPLFLQCIHAVNRQQENSHPLLTACHHENYPGKLLNFLQRLREEKQKSTWCEIRTRVK